MSASLVGSEMCIRDRFGAVVVLTHGLCGRSYGRARPQRRRDAQSGGQRLERVAVLAGPARQLHSEG
eukprot:8610926-Alexandrium_andersonii.AAC.1